MERFDEPGSYEIRVGVRLDDRWSSWFDGLTLSPGADGSTVLRGPVTDQSALHGLLQKVRDLGLPLISVRPTATPAHPDSRSTA